MVLCALRARIRAGSRARRAGSFLCSCKERNQRKHVYPHLAVPRRYAGTAAPLHSARHTGPGYSVRGFVLLVLLNSVAFEPRRRAEHRRAAEARTRRGARGIALVRIRDKDIPYADPLRQPRCEDKSAGQPICATGLYAARRARHRDVPSDTRDLCGRSLPGQDGFGDFPRKESHPGVQGAERPAVF